MIGVFVNTCSARRGAIDETLESVRRSDVGNAFELREGPTLADCGIAALNAWMREEIRRIARRHDWVLRLEDDVVVNRHVLSNVRSWRALRDPLFAYGTLFYQQMHERRFESTFWGTVSNRHENGTQGVVYRTEVLERIFAEMGPPNPKVVEWDGELWSAVKRLGLRHYVHVPAIVGGAAHSAESALTGRRRNAHGNDRFDPEWKNQDA